MSDSLTLHLDNGQSPDNPVTVSLTIDVPDSVDLQSALANNLVKMNMTGNVTAAIGGQTARQYSARIDLQLIDNGVAAVDSTNPVTITII